MVDRVTGDSPASDQQTKHGSRKGLSSRPPQATWLAREGRSGSVAGNSIAGDLPSLQMPGNSCLRVGPDFLSALSSLLIFILECRRNNVHLSEISGLPIAIIAH